MHIFDDDELALGPSFLHHHASVVAREKSMAHHRRQNGFLSVSITKINNAILIGSRAISVLMYFSGETRVFIYVI